jgi:hypothetical protein
MTLLNVEASVPAEMWAVVRFLLSVRGECDRELAGRLLAPRSLLPEEDDTFKQAVKSLSDLSLVSAVGTTISLTEPACKLSPRDLAGYTRQLRQAVLDPKHNVGLAETDDLKGAKDLVRALAWFLTRDALTPLGLDEVKQHGDGAFPDGIRNPIRNDTRWNRFLYWAPALGFAARPLFGGGSSQLVPDCTVAVRHIVLDLWDKGATVNAADMVDRILGELPVLPGGSYSRALGLQGPDGHVSSALSFALLAMHDEACIKLDWLDDASGGIFVADMDAASGARRVSTITVNGSAQ